MDCFIRLTLGWSLFISICGAAEPPPLTKNLIAACKSNDLPKVQQCIAEGVDVNAADEAGLPPIFHAVAAKNLSIVRLLLDSKAKLDAAHSGPCLMVKALQIGDMELFKMLAAAGGDLHRRYYIGDDGHGTLLHVAVMEDDLEMARYLLSQKVSTETRNSDGESALILAAQMDNLEIVKLLIENGAYFHALCPDYRTLLDSEMYRPSPQIKRYLQEIEQRRLSKIVEPSWTQFIRPIQFVTEIDEEGLAAWMADAGDLTRKDKQDRTLLHYLAEAGSDKIDLFETVVSALAAEVNAADLRGQTPLHLACADNAVQQCRILLDRGADVNARDRNENTPLCLLTRYHCNHTSYPEDELRIAEMLLEKGADVNAADVFGCTPLLNLGEANMDCHLELTRLLIARGADLNRQDHQGNTFLLGAAEMGTAAMMKIAIEAGADLSIRNYYGMSIQKIARYDAEEKLQLLYQYKKDVTLPEAVYYSQSALVDQLIQNGADVNAKLDDGSTPLILASQRNDSAMIIKLLTLAAGINAQDNSGSTALHYAAAQGYDEIVRILLANKADVTLRNQDGLRAIDLAGIENKYRTLQLFKDVYPDMEPAKKSAIEQAQGAPLRINAPGLTQQQLAELNEQVLKQLQSITDADPNLLKQPGLALAEVSDPNLIEAQMRADQNRWRTEALLSQTSKPLHIAVIKGELEKVKQMLADEPNLAESDDAGMLPLTYAVILENKPLINLLLERGADINQLDSNANFANTIGIEGWGHTVGFAAGRSVIHYAVAAGTEEMLDFLLQKGADINLGDIERGEGPIFTAHAAHRPEMLRKLFKAGADFKHADKNGDTLMHLMARYGRIDDLKFLLELGVPIDIKNPSGATPLMTAVRMGKPDAMLFLLEKGADIKALNASGGDLLCSSIAATYTYETLRILVEYGLDVNLKNSKGEPALFCLFNYGSKMKDLRKNVQLLLDAGIDVNATDKQGNTVLHYAARESYKDAAGMVEFAELMIARGADVNRTNAKGETPLGIMLDHQTCEPKELIRLLAENNTALNNVDRYGRNTLHNAAIHGCADIVTLLASKGADLENKENDMPGGKTPLLAAVSEGNVDVVRALLEAGANVAAQDKRQTTPIFSAIQEENTEIIQLLLDHGADINAPNKYGNTPLHAAVETGKPEIVQFLLNAGARKDIVGRSNMTAAQLAQRMNKPEIVALFQ
ncbi:MAG: ankyrin repeat domain-containing protein [Planctomycetaceae bacterium]|nr:ankyrin repeat domain-containing protein [Planctomycetaceae bacterium]